MFHKFVRISTFPRIIKASYYLNNRNKPIVYTNFHRFYADDSSKDSKSPNPKDSTKKVKLQNVCVTSRKHPEDICKPGPKRPCLPSPPPFAIGPRPCPRSSKMDSLPKPSCPWDETMEEKNKKYLKHLIIGILMTAVTIVVLWYNTRLTKEEKIDKKKEKAYKRPKPTCRIPPSAEIPSEVPYLLIGGGTASFSAFRAIKSADPTAKVLVVSNECYYPYMRPPLSKEMWINNNDENSEKLIFKQWNGTERSLYYEPQDFYIKASELKSNPNGGVAIIQGYTVTKIDVVNKTAYLDNGKSIAYDKCLIATGSKPRKLEIFETASKQIQEKVSIYRDIFDFQELNEICKDVKSIAIIGGGFLGSELACALGKLGQQQDFQVYQLYRESGNMGKILPQYLSDWTTDKVRKEMVNIISKVELEDATLNNKNQLILHLNNGRKLTVDHVIVAVGAVPNTDLAKTSDLEIDPKKGGFLVNAEMEARSDLFVAGDCSCFYDIKLGRRRVEHHDHAVVSGRLAGENMAGAAKPYTHQSMFWSDLGPRIGYEAIGHVDSKLPTVAVFAKATKKDTPAAVVQATNNNIRSTTEESAVTYLSNDNSSEDLEKSDDYGKGVIFYLRDDVVVGIVLWNVFNRMSIARQVLKEEKKYDDLNEVAKLFNIHED